MTVMKASVTEVNLGTGHKIEGLMFEDGSFGVAVVQVCKMFKLDKVHGTRDIKTMLGGELEITKAKTPLSINAINAMSLETFDNVITALCLKGNKAALELSTVLRKLSLHQIFCDAFKVKFTRRGRDKWLRNSSAEKEACLSPELNEAVKALQKQGKRIDHNKVAESIYGICGLQDKYNQYKDNGEKEKPFKETLNSSELETVKSVEHLLTVLTSGGTPLTKALAKLAQLEL